MNKRRVYPFSAIVGQEEMKLALILNVINPTLSGVLIRGEKGTAKSTIVRALAGILPKIEMVQGCSFGLHPKVDRDLCSSCAALLGSGESLDAENRPIRVVDLPLLALPKTESWVRRQ